MKNIFLAILILFSFSSFAQLRSAGTGSGSIVYSTSPTLVTPNLGTPTTLVATNATGTAAGLTAGNVTTNANLTGDVTSSGNATTIGALKVTTGMLAANAATLAKLDASNATANKVLMSGASASPTWSTPTFPNASATTLKIIKSDGTNWVASTETYAAPSTSGNIMISDGTNWTSAVRYPIQVATADIASTASATSTTTIFTPSADGMYRVSVYLKITTTGTSPVAGPVTITYTDADGSVAQSHVLLLANTVGAVVTTTVNNTTTTGTVYGSIVMNAKSGVAIQYAIAVSGTFGAGRYTAHLTCERIK